MRERNIQMRERNIMMIKKTTYKKKRIASKS